MSFHKSIVDVFKEGFTQTWTVGIEEGKRFYNSDYKASPTQKFYGREENKERALVNKRGKGFWGKKATTGKSLAYILNSEKYDIPKSFLSENYIYDSMVYEICVRNEGEEKRDRRIGNFLAGSLRRHYLKAMARYHNKARRIKQKGFDRFGVGTGQILSEIKAEKSK